MKTITYTALSLIMFCAPVYAAENNGGESTPVALDAFSFSATVTATSDYVFRGISQNDEKAALQASVDVEHESGFYAGLWGSPVDFNDGEEAEVEIDWYAGYAYETGPWNADTRLTYYWYPGAEDSLDYDYTELSFEGAYDFGSLALGGLFAYSPEYFGNSGDAEYIQAKLDLPLPENFSAHAYLGRQFIDDNATYGYPDITDWNLGFGYSWEALELDLSYIDTDLNRSECTDGCESRVVLTASYTF